MTCACLRYSASHRQIAGRIDGRKENLFHAPPPLPGGGEENIGKVVDSIRVMWVLWLMSSHLQIRLP